MIGATKKNFASVPDDDVVISGISGRFPESRNMKEYKENLFAKKDLITDDGRRWKLDHPEIPQHTGKISNIEKFDAEFFHISPEEAESMDPGCRMLLEHTFEAIVDAGYNPSAFRNTNTGVYIAASFSESQTVWLYEDTPVRGLGALGCNKGMLANHISAWLGVTGPSLNIDTACSASLFAVDNAYRALKNGRCDAAIVGGANLCLHPYISLQFTRLGLLSPEGKCKTFDEDANGYTRSETMAIILMQRAKDARRIYASVVYAKTNCDGFKQEGITFPSTAMQSSLLREFYAKCGVPPSYLSYFEAHGTGTKVGDPEEVNAIDQVICAARTTPLKIGSIKSNLGHAEPASGLCAIGKIIIAMETGLIPPNLHFKKPKESITALKSGRVQVVTELTPWECDYAALSSFGFGGANAHILLKGNPKEKVNNGLPQDNLPRLVCVSGRTADAVKTLLDELDGKPVDVEQVALLHEVHADNIPGHLYRGYTIIGVKGAMDPPIREIRKCAGSKKQIWFMFSGMDAPWDGVGMDFLRFPVFLETIIKCDAVLKPLGINLYNILTSKDGTIWNDVTNLFVGTVAVQIGLVDLLSSLRIIPDGMIGSSIGELACAYADECLTVEQVMLAAYYSARAPIDAKVDPGSMAFVKVDYKNLKNVLPEKVQVVSQNGAENTVIGGPVETVTKFVAQLRSKGVFAKEVACGGIPYHTRYMADAKETLLKRLRGVIPNPKPRCTKWLSTAIPREEWTKAKGHSSSAEYHTSSLLNPVLLEQAIVLVPRGAVVIEIAPRGTLQSLLRKTGPSPSVISVPILAHLDLAHKDNVASLLGSLGTLYVSGVQPDIKNLYPPVSYPVSRSTPMISPYIKWDHSKNWYVFSYHSYGVFCNSERTLELSLADDNFEYMKGHVVDGRNLLPATGYLEFVWETLGMMSGELYTEVPVVFENVKFLRATTVSRNTIKLTIIIHKGTGAFEVSEEGAAVCTGEVRATSNPDEETIKPYEVDDDDEPEVMTSKDVYKVFRLRGYHYTGLFRSIQSASTSGTKGHIAWRNNWVSYLDNMLQMKILGVDTRRLFVPTAIDKVVIDTKKHIRQLRDIPSQQKILPVRVSKELDTVVSGGIEIRGLKATIIARKKEASDPVLEEYKFVPYCDRSKTSLVEAVQVATHIALENYLSPKIKTVELVTEGDDVSPQMLASPLISHILGNLPLIQASIVLAAPAAMSLNNAGLPQNVTITAPNKLTTTDNSGSLLGSGFNLLTEGDEFSRLTLLSSLVRDDGFILSREKTADVNLESVLSDKRLNLVLRKQVGEEHLILLRKKVKIPKTVFVVNISNDDLEWVPRLQGILTKQTGMSGTYRVYLVSERNFESGLLGFANCFRREGGESTARVVLIQDPEAPEFDPKNPLYQRQLDLDLAFNVLRPGNVWGSYRHLPIPVLAPRPVFHGLIDQTTYGDISSLKWLEGPIRDDAKDPYLTYIHYASINFRDVMTASGKLSLELQDDAEQWQETIIGFECSGVTSNGRRVMGLMSSGMLSNCCVADKFLLWDVPADWSLEDAGTVPCVYATCYYALYYTAKIKKSDRVLIHSGTGGVGQAAINLALHEGCEVFTTVGTTDKRRFIRTHFPQIPEDHIGNSRDTSFEQMIMTHTNNEGVDIVLNSLAEEKLQASIRCLGKSGRFLEIGKYDLLNNSELSLKVFQKNICFCGIMLDAAFNAHEDLKKALQVLLADGIKAGAVKPLVRTVFPRDQVKEAFRFMAAGKHIGKVLVKVRDEEEPLDKSILAIRRFYCQANRSYVIFGGLGGFGLELGDWLVRRGAKSLFLISRRGVINGYQKKYESLWKSYGVKVNVMVVEEAWKREICENILESASRSAPVDAIFNLAVVLSDNVFENQTVESFRVAFNSKVRITQQLDKSSREMCPQLRYFVVFSSVSCGRGNIGQTNYGMANSVMERICEKRMAEGLHGLAIQWGAVGDVGLVADMQDNHKVLVIGGTLQQRITSCLRALDRFLMQNSSPVVSSMVVAEKRSIGVGTDTVVDSVLNIMGIKNVKSVSPKVSLTELGMDSMAAVEIKQTLEREFEIFLTAQEIRMLNFAKLMEYDKRNEREQGVDDKQVNERVQDKTIEGLRVFVHLLENSHLNSERSLELPTQRQAGEREIFIVPGIEGVAQVLKKLVPKLRNPVTCLQLGFQHQGLEDIESMATALWHPARERSRGRKTFTIIGYSFGCILALELARKFETEGLSGELVLIDGSPEYLNAIIEQQLPSESISDIETNILMGIMDMVSPKTSDQLLKELLRCTSWEVKLQKFLELLLLSPDGLSRQDQENCCTAILKRVTAVPKYCKEAKPPIKAPITLIKPKTRIVPVTSEYYGLEKMTEGKIDVHVVEGNHLTILESDKVADLINKVGAEKI